MFYDEVERIVALEHLIKLHEATMIQSPHDIDFVDE